MIPTRPMTLVNEPGLHLHLPFPRFARLGGRCRDRAEARARGLGHRLPHLRLIEPSLDFMGSPPAIVDVALRVSFKKILAGRFCHIGLQSSSPSLSRRFRHHVLRGRTSVSTRHLHGRQTALARVEFQRYVGQLPRISRDGVVVAPTLLRLERGVQMLDPLTPPDDSTHRFQGG